VSRLSTKQRRARRRRREHYQHLAERRFLGFEECLGCGCDIEMYDEPDEWSVETGEVLGYGPATGICEPCELLHVVQPWDGVLEAYDVSRKGRAA
jgi:hypothetical protein